MIPKDKQVLNNCNKNTQKNPKIFLRIPGTVNQVKKSKTQKHKNKQKRLRARTGAKDPEPGKPARPT